MAPKFRKMHRPTQFSSRKEKSGTGNENLMNVCIGIGLKLQNRDERSNPYNSACSWRCRHPIQAPPRILKKTLSGEMHDEWIADYIYKKYAETDSRPLSPDIIPQRSVKSLGVKAVSKHSTFQRRCVTPDPPDTTELEIQSRRLVILDLRKVRSMDVVVRQESLTSTGTNSGLDEDEEDANYIGDKAEKWSRESSSSIRLTEKKLSNRRRSKKAHSSEDCEKLINPKTEDGVSRQDV